MAALARGTPAPGLKPLAVAALVLLATPAVAAPGDPRALRGTLEWPPALWTEPVAVIRGEDGRLYYADVSTAQRVGGGPIAGQISVVGVEGTRPHEIAAGAIGAGDNALAALNSAPPARPGAVIAPAPTMPPPVAPQPSASLPYTPPPAPAAARAPAQTDDLWQVQGRVKAVTGREMVIETIPGGQTVRVDISKLSQWTRDSVRPGDELKLFGIPQKDRRLVANGFIQFVPAAPAASPAVTR